MEIEDAWRDNLWRRVVEFAELENVSNGVL